MELKEITLTLTAQELNIIGAALGELPYKVSSAVVQSINNQVNAALAALTPPAPQEGEKPCVN